MAASLTIQCEKSLVDVQCEPFLFGGVYCGAHARMPILLTNHGRADAVVAFDLSKMVMLPLRP